jgi:hypothetical protein
MLLYSSKVVTQMAGVMHCIDLLKKGRIEIYGKDINLKRRMRVKGENKPKILKPP